MTKLKERETPSQNIAFLGIMAAVIIVLTEIASFVPFVTILAIFILSAASALGTRITKFRYSIPFLVATSAIVVSLDTTEGLFYFFPSILCGGLYGILSKIKCPTTYTILAVSFLSLGLNYLAVPILNVLTGLNPIEATIELLGWKSYENVLKAFPGLLLALGLCQTVLSHFLIVLLHDRLEIKSQKESPLADGIGAIVFGIIAIAAGLFVLEIGYIAFVASIYLLAVVIYDLVLTKRKIAYILSAVLIVAGVFLIAFVSPLLETPKAILLGGYYPITLGIILILFPLKKNVDIAK